MIDLFGLVGCFLVLVFGIYSLFKSDSIDEMYREYHECTKAWCEEQWKKSDMRKIDVLINTLGALQDTDERPAMGRLCKSLIETLKKIDAEHKEECEKLKTDISKANLVNSEQMTKIEELETQLKAMSDLANSAMADAQKCQNAYLNLRVETPIVQKTDATWYMNDQPVSEASVFAQQAHTAMTAQEERIPRYGYHKYHIKYYSYKDHQWHETELWCGGMKDVEDWVIGVCGGGMPMYDCRMIA